MDEKEVDLSHAIGFDDDKNEFCMLCGSRKIALLEPCTHQAGPYISQLHNQIEFLKSAVASNLVGDIGDDFARFGDTLVKTDGLEMGVIMDDIE